MSVSISQYTTDRDIPWHAWIREQDRVQSTNLHEPSVHHWRIGSLVLDDGGANNDHGPIQHEASVTRTLYSHGHGYCADNIYHGIYELQQHECVSSDFKETAKQLLGDSCGYGNYAGLANDSSGYLDYEVAPHLVPQLNVTHEDFLQGNLAPALPQAHAYGVPQAPINGVPQPSGAVSLTCPHGCRSTFGRAGEYRRHMKKHTIPSLLCPQPGCNKTFYRKDKVKDHLRQGHGIVQPRRARGAAIIGAAPMASASGGGQV